MRNFYTFLVFIALFITAGAQVTDYEVVGFADAEGNVISSIVMESTEDLQPRVILKNNGPGIAALTDTVFLDVFYNDDYYVTSVVMLGSQLHSVTAGEQAIIDLNAPIWTAETMDDYNLIACSICFEVRVAGTITDPNPNNNRSCINVTRVLDISDAEAANISLFPNPVSSSVTFSGATGSRVQILDMSGRMIYCQENISENQIVDVSSFANGIYIVRISQGNMLVAKKMIVSH